MKTPDMEDKEWIMRYGVQCLALCAIFAAILCGCGVRKESSEPAVGKEEAEEVRIGITFDSFIIERWQRDRDVFVSTAKELGAEVIVQNANGDVAEQKAQIEYFIKKKVDVIVIVAVDSAALKEEVEKARKADIRVIAYDRMLLDSNADLYVSFDNEMVGVYMAETMLEAMPDGGKILKINGPIKDNNVKLVNEGFDKTISGSGIEVIDTIHASEWKGEEAFNYLNANTKRLYQADGIMCGNDSLAGQAIRALSERRLAGKIVVVGQDADIDACQRIVEGTQTMTVYKSIEKLARAAAESAVALAEGGHTYAVVRQDNGSLVLRRRNEAVLDLEEISDGTNSIPYLRIEPEKVTKQNIDEVIIDGGFHLREDVYLNMPEGEKVP